MRRDGAHIGLALGVLVVAGWYVVALALGADQTGAETVYNRVAEALIHGHTDLGPAPAGLLALPDPYDPGANEAFRAAGLHDLSLHDGRLYAYWGPVPALLLYAPARLAGQLLPDGWAILVLSLGSLLVAVALLRLALARTGLRLTGPMAFAAALGLGAANLTPHLLSRPAQYEVAIAAATLFVLASLLLALLAGLDTDAPRRWALAGAGLCSGLAAGSRATCGLVIAAVLWLIVRRARGRGEPLRAQAPLLATALAPFAVVVAGLLAYNQLRFGTPLEFGRRWQLTVVDLSDASPIDLASFGPALWNYLAPPPLLRAQFPFLYGNPGVTYPFAVPGSYVSGDAVIGVAVLAPLTLVLLAAPRLLRGAAPAARSLVVLLVATGALLLAPLLVLRAAPAAIRYEADFLPAWLLAAVVVWAAWHARRGGRLVAGAGIAVLLWTSLVMGLASLENNLALSERHRGAFESLERTFSPVAVGMAAVAGHPVLARVDGQQGGPPFRYDRVGVEGASVAVGRDPVELRVIAASDSRAALRAAVSGGPVLVTLRGVERPLHEGRAALGLARGVNVVVLRAPSGRARLTGLSVR